ncbi:MAG: hypothetical protein ACI9WC_001092 [Arenicella sp.]|jgi:hypothetical protein
MSNQAVFAEYIANKNRNSIRGVDAWCILFLLDITLLNSTHKIGVAL